MEQVNELLRAELAQLANEYIELEAGLVTITRVKCSADLRAATVFVSVLPETMNGSALSSLRRNSRHFSNRLKEKVRIKYIPRFNWKIDSTEQEADKLEKAIIEMNK